MVSEIRQIAAVRTLLENVRQLQEINATVQLWDGSEFPLAKNVTGPLRFTIAGPEVIGRLLRRPKLDTLLKSHVMGGLGIEGGTLIDVAALLPTKESRRKLKAIDRKKLLRIVPKFLFSGLGQGVGTRSYAGDESGRAETRDNEAMIRFHYDVSNKFYGLFLDPEMVYSCGYFTKWTGGLARAQTDKLEMICRKLRLKKGDRFLDIGCGWGALLCHAVKHHGVTGHGITLSRAQFDYATKKARRLGLEQKIKIEIRDYADLEGEFDKIASIGMFEHIGLVNIPGYIGAVNRVLAADGLFLNHAITRGAKGSKKQFARMRPEKKAIQQYIFPGGELDNIGHTLSAFEVHGFEVHDVEGWREHYARTTRLWCERLYKNSDKAIAEVGEETYRIWLAYLAGVSLSFERGSLRIFQTLVSKRRASPSGLPPTRADLYK